MPQIVYVGPFDRVNVPAFRLGDVVPGEPVEVTAEQAASLLEQVGNWAEPGSPAAKAAAKRVADAAKRVEAEQREAQLAERRAAGTLAEPGTKDAAPAAVREG